MILTQKTLYGNRLIIFDCKKCSLKNESETKLIVDINFFLLYNMQKEIPNPKGVLKMENKILKIASYNIQSCRNHPDRNQIDAHFSANVINEYMPDIIGLNEVSSGKIYGEQPKELAEIIGYPYYFYAPILEFPGRLYGNGIISKYPIKNAEMIPIPDPEVKDEDAYYETRCVLKAEIDVLGGITVLVSHFGLANSEKKNAVKTVCEILGLNPEKTLLMGDFNVTPDCEYLNPIKDVLNDTASGYDESKLLSWPSDEGQRKIDYIFASKDFKVLNTEVSVTIGSDHKMIVADLELTEE